LYVGRSGGVRRALHRYLDAHRIDGTARSNGLIGTDAICAEAIVGHAGDELDALVAPTIAVGMTQHHMAFAGSMTLRPSTILRVIQDSLTSLARHGFTHFYFVNVHGGNVASLTAAFDEVYAGKSLHEGNGAPLRCRTVNWWMGDRTRKLRDELYGAKEGAHATPSEVALTQYLRPETIKRVAIDGTAPHATAFTDADDYRAKFPDGRMGSDPSLATPEDGRRLLDACVADVVEDYRKFVGNG
jgi:creatinine amidohydrolase